MSTIQVDDTAAEVLSELAPVHGMDQIMQDFSQEDIGLILPVGICKVQEYQFIKGIHPEDRISSLKTLQEYFGPNTRLISKCTHGKKYCYYKETKKRPESQKTVLKYKPAAEGRPSTMSLSATANKPKESVKPM